MPHGRCGRAIRETIRPVSLLTPLAKDLRITEGLAGQTVTATAAVGLVTSLLIAVAARNLNRRVLLLVLSILQVVSNLLVAFAPDLPRLIVALLPSSRHDMPVSPVRRA